ncbi:MFS transporter [Pseudomaricurvus sp.]|uniref:MFS transporter n=1 Tax=Pseudomaricurvus sp. TaxID=2004510 RepID=UPI003F6ADCFB
MKMFERVLSIYTGWKVLSAAFICAAMALGFTVYVFGVFVVPVSAEFGLSRAAANNGMIALQLGAVVMSPLVGRLMDKFSARHIMMLGGVSFGGALMLTSRAQSPEFMLFMLTVPLTFGYAACGVLGANTVVVRWFSKRRGRALGILALSTSVGGMVSQPLTALLIEAFGWRTALFQIGLIATVGFLSMAIFVIRNSPAGNEPGYQKEFIGSDSSTEQGNTAEHAVLQERPWTYKELFCNRNFWLLSIGIGLMQASDQTLLASQVPHFQDLGFTIETAALLASIKTFSAIGGKIIVGYFADKVDLRWLFLFVAGSNIGILTVYMMQPSFELLLCTVALLGVAVGGVFPVWTTLISWLFGPRSFGTVMGVMMIITNPLAIVALRASGVIHDTYGSYTPAFGGLIAMVVTATILIMMLKPPESRE